MPSPTRKLSPTPTFIQTGPTLKVTSTSPPPFGVKSSARQKNFRQTRANPKTNEDIQKNPLANGSLSGNFPKNSRVWPRNSGSKTPLGFQSVIADKKPLKNKGR